MKCATHTLPVDGYVLYRAAASSLLHQLHALSNRLPPRLGGTRLRGEPGLPALLNTGAMQAIAASYLGDEARPVRAILFDKRPSDNWALGWHQDRTIAVRERREVAGYGPWTVKQGILHVAPPFAVIEAMVTLRIHLDDTPRDNAPLLVSPGSHRLGLVAERDIAAAVSACGVMTCLAAAGDVWAYATPILHASAASSGHAHRRVLQVDYTATKLPEGLDWLGI